MPSNWYCSRDSLKAALSFSATDTLDDDQIDLILEAVSRAIETHCHRWFYPRTQTRYYTAQHGDHLDVDDLLAVTTLKTDDDGDRTYENTWASTDYDLMPFNAASEQTPEPYWSLGVSPDGDYTFPRTSKGVEIVGSWGYFNVRKTSSATLSEALDASETGVDVSDGTQFGVGETILIDSEQMWISAITTNTLTVTRAVNGTTAATHTSGATIQVYEYPVIGQACKFQAKMDLQASNAPTGVLGSTETGTVSVRSAGGLHPFVLRMLAPFRRASVA